MRKRLFSLLFLCLLLVSTTTPAFAQNYRFRVDQAEVSYYINADGTASVEYTYTFFNDPSGSPIDFVDVGMPSKNYSLSGIVAEVNGQAITDIQNSDFVDQAVALGLGSNAIPPGQSGTVYLWVPIIERIIYPADKNDGKENYASIEFQPNYFGSEFVYGQTDLTVNILLPPGMDETQPVFYTPSSNWPGEDQPSALINNEGRVVYTWYSPDANTSSKYVFGAGFPKELVPEEAIVTPPAINFSFDPSILCCLGFGGLFAGMIGWGIVSSRKRRLQYLPPKIAVEGHGIKRGLTAVEAAILMQQPMDKIMTMILFSTVKKGAARVETRDPLTIAVARNLPEGLQAYETDFLKAFQTGNVKERRELLQTVMIGLVKSVTEKMRGFSRKETVDYYENIIKQAWAQVEAADTPEVKSQKYDEVMDWTMLDKEYDGRTREVFRTGPVFLPRWWGNYDPVYRGSIGSAGGAGSGMPSTVGGSVQLPHLPGADFAASVANGVSDFSANVIGDLFGFTGAVTDKTNPPPPPPKSSSRGGGGGGRSCACACACAGCACACAGGGR